MMRNVKIAMALTAMLLAVVIGSPGASARPPIEPGSTLCVTNIGQTPRPTPTCFVVPTPTP